MPRNVLLARPVPGLWSLCIPLGGCKHCWPRKVWQLPVWCNFGKEGGFFPSHQTPPAQHSHPRGDPGALNAALQRRKVAH